MLDTAVAAAAEATADGSAGVPARLRLVPRAAAGFRPAGFFDIGAEAGSGRKERSKVSSPKSLGSGTVDRADAMDDAKMPLLEGAGFRFFAGVSTYVSALRACSRAMTEGRGRRHGEHGVTRSRGQALGSGLWALGGAHGVTRPTRGQPAEEKSKVQSPMSKVGRVGIGNYEL